jgi:ketosteroid isomerase-like protein
MTDLASLEKRIRQLEDREQIKELVSRYGFVVDNRDLKGLEACFTETAAVLSKDGRHASRGREDVMKQYNHRFSFLGPTNHFTHNHVISFDETNPDRAYGYLNAHGEVVRNGHAMMSALRYDDEYARDKDGKWKFQLRMMTYLYYLKFDEIQKYLGDPMRVRAYPEPQRADWPEGVETYTDFYEKNPRQPGL